MRPHPGLAVLVIDVGLVVAVLSLSANAALVSCPASIAADPMANVISGGMTAPIPILSTFVFAQTASSGNSTTPLTDPRCGLTGEPPAVSQLSISRTVPESSTLALLGTALISLAVRERRRRVV